ncbi:MAG: hypothetical protein KIT45_13615, partial [Fimbriimonadia bacterium]|nr:hypothetical protein [Fimbriimonadia bacterium]
FPLNIGGGGSAPATYHGALDEIRIWRRARTAREIQRDMNAVLVGNETGLAAYYRLDEGHGTQALNSATGGGLTANLANGARWFGSQAPIDTVNVFFPNPRAFRLGGFDINNNALSYPVLTNPTRGVLSGNTPDLIYTPVRGGQDQMTYRVQDQVSFQNGLAKFRTWVPGDVNGDGCVNDNDLLMVLFAFGQTGSNLLEDVNEDGTVNDNDLLIVLFNFGAGC